MIQTKETTIDDVRYMVTQFPARRALKIKAKLARLLAPSALAATASVKSGSLLNGELDTSVLANAVDMLVNKLNDDQFVNLILEILACTRREGKELTESHFDMVYAGNFGELYKAIKFTLEVNFGSFLSGLRIGNLIKQHLTEEPSQEI